MPRLALWIAIALIVVGLIGYLATGRASFTALIPAFFGIPLLILGVVGLRPGARKHAMHAAAAWAVIGFVATADGLARVLPLIAGREIDRPSAVISKAIMAVLCAIFVIYAVRSFMIARRTPAR